MDDREAKPISLLAEYQGLPGRTREEAIHYSCARCGTLFGGAVHTVINVGTDPDLGKRLAEGELNVLSCPACKALCTPSVALVYHDPKARRFAVVLPESMRHLELHERARVLLSLLDDPCDVPDYVRGVDVVFGASGLMRLLDAAQAPETSEADRAGALAERLAALEERAGELLAREEDLQAKEEDLIALKDKLERERLELAKGWGELARERGALRALSLEIEAREEILVSRAEQAMAQQAQESAAEEPTDPAGSRLAKLLEPAETRSAPEIDAWRASEEPTAVLRWEGCTLLLARVEGGRQQRFLGERDPELLVQLMRMPAGPLIALVALPPAPSSADPAEQALYWLVDPASASQREILDALAEDCVVHLELYDEESRPLGSRELHAPLAENIRLFRERAAALLERGPADFAQAVREHRELGPQRLGLKKHNFSADSFRELAMPASVKLALGIVAYWSEPENEDYLLEVKAFPVVHWRGIRERVVRRAIDCGLRLSPALTRFAIQHKLIRGKRELLQCSLANFAEVSLRIRPCDLDPLQELENWRLLLSDCVREGVTVDLEFEELAAATARRAGVAEDETAAGGDLSLLSEEALLALLSDRAQRRDAALELCERGSPMLAEHIYRAVCIMTRPEVARVIPAMLPLGRRVTQLFVQGLKHRKSFVRQGCALALGASRAKEAIAALIEVLLSEPSNVWREISRALGDMGSQVLKPLVANVAAADAEGRERIAWALAQAALAPACGARLQELAKGRNAQLARVAQRALELVEQVRRNDQEVRGARPLEDHTIVRNFTRQFFEALPAESRELNEDDIVDQEEVLDDNDILEESMVVQDEDILGAPAKD